MWGNKCCSDKERDSEKKEEEQLACQINDSISLAYLCMKKLLSIEEEKPDFKQKKRKRKK